MSANPSTVPRSAGAAEPLPPRRNEWLLVAFTGTTNTADAVMRVALPLLVTRFTTSPALVAAVSIMLSLPWLVTALHIGVLVDRRNRRSLMAGAEFARMVAIGALALAVVFDIGGLPVIYAVALVLGVAEVVAQLSAASIIPAAVPRSRWQTVNARLTGTEYVSFSFVGAPIGGFLVAAGFAVALGATGAAYLIGALLLTMLVGNFTPAPAKERRPARAEIKEGLSFLLGHPLLRSMALLITVMAGCWAAWYALIPVYAIGPLHLTAQQYGFLLTCLGAGGVLGTVLVGPVNRLIGRRWAMFVDIIGTALMVGIPAVLPSTPGSAWVIGAAAFAAGIGGTMWTVNSRVITQSLVPNEMLGRFNAASRLISWGMLPVAAAVAGGLAQLFGYRIAFGLFAVLCLLLVYLFLRVITPGMLDEVDAPAEEPA
ncbi:MFS transporter [Labedaea rhizosphaerae]|uniref:Putative MFS family arabinose efflux permease n=1 Tax=Labedaea rhizosphaerae TaxID=598644 RepID=A0A4R6S2H1_LABRH|nr:MFS transporter [Labedaea rhizosphaerae]TDP92846.1 putative MFS family arabinose efflux permease [Labedaea rhizosphaerae]